ncbi:MAG: DUF3987 domain-containing protein [Sphingobacteriales bacterium]|nr:MAG: DUF3987 domain-containing protein [Sphingobacteriales bacterium]
MRKNYNGRLDFANRNSGENFETLVEINIEQYGPFVLKDEVWIDSLVKLCNEFGMEFESARDNVIRYVGVRPGGSEITMLRFYIVRVNDIYERDLSLHGTWESRNDEEYHTPTFPRSVYENLPRFLKDMTTLYEIPRERDIMLLSTLTVLSALFPKVYGIYDKRKYSANVYLLIIAPPASGKGTVAIVRTLGSEIQRQLHLGFQREYTRYKEEQNESSNDNDDAEGIIKPYPKLLFIPANNTSAKVIETLKRNRDFGIIMDTEADTLTQSLKSQYGGFSDLLRKAFQNEAIESQRKLNDEHNLISRAALSVLLTCTPSQVDALLNNVGNGLDTRFMYYEFTGKKAWKDVFEEPDILPEVAFNNMALELADFTTRWGSFNESADNLEIMFTLTGAQQLAFNRWFTEKSSLLAKVCGDDIISSVRRLGLITWRLAMTLSIIRQIDSNHKPQSIECHDDDFSTAFAITECLIFHTTKVFDQLKELKTSKQKVKPDQTKPVDRFWTKLPSVFSWKEAVEIAGHLGIKDKTAGNYIAKYIIDSKLLRTSHGSYSKSC